MNITNILVDRATSVISSALFGGGGARQRLPHTHAHRADSDRWREGVNPLRYKVFCDNYSQLGRTSPNGLGFKAAIFSSGVGTFWL